jgi:putative thioredoxin
MTGAVDLSGLKQPAGPPSGPGGPAPSAAGAGPGVTVTEANFEAEVLLRSEEAPVVVLLWSPRSDACVQLLETLSGLAAQDKGTWSLATVNVDVAPRVAQIFGVDAVPTVVALAAGQPVSSFQGLQPAEQLRGWLDQILSATAGKLRGSTDSGEPEAVDPELAAARQQLDAGDFEAAKKSYQSILDANRPVLKPRVRFGKSTSSPAQPRNPRTPSPPPTPHRATLKPPLRRPTCKCSTRTSVPHLSA